MTNPIFLRIEGETPAKKNSRITLRNGRTIPSKRYRLWHGSAITQLQTQWGKREPLDIPLRIKMIFHHSDNRRRDSDNGVSSIFDTLQDAGIISDDRWQIVRRFSVENEKNDTAFVEIQILAVEE